MIDILPKVRRQVGPRDTMGWGRGFSDSELREVGLSLRLARRLGIVTDTRRRTKYQENVDRLREWLSTTGKSLPELTKSVSPRRRLKSGPCTGRAFRGLTSSGKRTRGLLRSRGLKRTR